MATLTPDYPLDLSQILGEEYVGLHHNLPEALQDRLTKIAVISPEDRRAADPTLLQDLYTHFHSSGINRTALCFSGGGIRSATFCLGVIQALARFNLLGKFDYLSTVSGGGYIGGWLTAWIHRLTKDKDRVRNHDEGVTQVTEAINESRLDRKMGLYSPEADPLRWLREYSNYLTPKVGLFSADFWTMIGISLRNLLLNWLVLIPLLTAVFMIPRLQTALLMRTDVPHAWVDGLLRFGLVVAFPALWYVHAFRPSLAKQRRDPEPGQPADSRSGGRNFDSQGWFIFIVLVPLVVSAYCVTTAWAWYPEVAFFHEDGLFGWPPIWIFAFVGAALHLAGWIFARLGRLSAEWISGWLTRNNTTSAPCQITGWTVLYLGLEFVMISLSGAIGGIALWAILHGISATYPVKTYAEWYAAFAVPGFLSVFLLIATLFIGLVGQFVEDDDHEFWGRAGSLTLNAATSIAAIGTLIIFGPELVVRIGAWTSVSIGGAAGLLSLIGGFSAKTLLQEARATDRVTRGLAYAVKIATPLFIVLLIVGFALGTSYLVTWWSELLGIRTVWKEQVVLRPNIPAVHAFSLHNAELGQLFLIWCALISIGLLMACLINVNKFSLHGFYRNRLIRAYLGASNTSRTPNQFTGFDKNDNIEMRDLGYLKKDKRPDGSSDFRSRTLQKPFHVINIALNLVSGKRRAWQQRKAQSFTVSPLHCGSWQQQLGYRSTKDYGLNQHVDRAISLGTALATSGAAASPNMGYHSSAAVTFLLALFNIRLGWWLGNPGEAGEKPFLGKLGKKFNLWPTYKRSCPAFSIRPLIAELFGLTDANRPYVYLSDGGHFENLGLYEMVLRRCHQIVVIDAGCDPEMSFQDLGNAIRKIRIDQGVNIEIDTDMIKPQNGSQLSRWHHAIGSIRYDKVDQGAPAGILIYLKPSLTGKEPSDVQDYAAHHKTFPHEPTSDQFFDESQFESYRQLGEQIAREVFNPIAADTLKKKPNSVPMSEMFYKLRSHWVTLPPGIQDSFLKQTDAFVRLDRMLRDDPDLARYDTEIYPELETILGGLPTSSLSHGNPGARLHYCMLQIQLMENVFLALNLDKYHAHPLNRGWMNFFRRWTAVEDFRQLWPVLRGSFSKAFVDFAGDKLNLGDSGQEVICKVTRDGTGALQQEVVCIVTRDGSGTLREEVISIVTRDGTGTLQEEVIREDTRAEPGTSQNLTPHTGHTPTGLIDFEPVIREFWQEWPDETQHHDFLTMFEIAGVPPNPPIIIAIPPRGVKTNSQVSGVAFAVKADATDEPEPGWRVFIWIRGAHRRLGIGRKLLDHLIAVLKDLPPPSESNGERKLIVILPELPRERPGYALEKAGWLHFFGRRGLQLVDEKGRYRLEGVIRDDAQQV